MTWFCLRLCKATRCPQNETPRFHKDWIHEAAVHLYHSLIPPDKRRLLKLPSKALVMEMLRKYDPDPDCGHWVKLGDRMEWQRTVAGPADLSTILAKAFKVSAGWGRGRKFSRRLNVPFVDCTGRRSEQRESYGPHPAAHGVLRQPRR